MNTIKSKKLLICTANMKSYEEDDYDNIITNMEFKEYSYDDTLPKNIAIAQEEIELDNGLMIRVRNGISKSDVIKYKIIYILEDTEKKIGYQFNSWFGDNNRTVEQPVFLGGIKNKNVKIKKLDNNNILIKTPYDLNLEFSDINGTSIIFKNIDEE